MTFDHHVHKTTVRRGGVCHLWRDRVVLFIFGAFSLTEFPLAYRQGVKPADYAVRRREGWGASIFMPLVSQYRRGRLLLRGEENSLRRVVPVYAL